MTTTVTIRDEVVWNIGKPPVEFILGFPTDCISVNELIRTRVYQEVERYNASQHEYFQGLVQPTGAELTLNGYRLPKQRRIDPERQFRNAVDAFQRNGFMILVNDQQVENLDDVIALGPETVLTFLKLVPLVGG